MNVPKDLYSLIGRKELRYSLKTGYIGTARYKARLIAGHVQQLFRFLRKEYRRLSELSDQKIQELAQQYLKEYIEGLENRYYDGSDNPINNPQGVSFWYASQG